MVRMQFERIICCLSPCQNTLNRTMRYPLKISNLGVQIAGDLDAFCRKKSNEEDE